MVKKMAKKIIEVLYNEEDHLVVKGGKNITKPVTNLEKKHSRTKK